MASKAGRITIVGGGIAGLSAAQKAQGLFDEVVLIDEGSYSGERRGAWGELIWNYQRFPLEKDNPGVVREVEKSTFEVDERNIVVSTPEGVIIDRGELEKYWASTLDVKIEEETRIDSDDLRDLAEESDLIIDASGPLPVSQEFIEVDHDIFAVTVSGEIKGDFSQFYPQAYGFPYKNHFGWIVPKSEERATVGLGCEFKNDPAEVYSDLKQALSTRGLEAPPLEQLYIGYDVSNGLTGLDHCQYQLEGTEVKLVGAAVGAANKITGFGMVHAAQTGQTAVESFLNNTSYHRDLVTDTLWRKMTEGLGAAVVDRYGVSAIAKHIPQNGSYKNTLDPDTPLDSFKAIEHEVEHLL